MTKTLLTLSRCHLLCFQLHCLAHKMYLQNKMHTVYSKGFPLGCGNNLCKQPVENIYCPKKKNIIFFFMQLQNGQTSVTIEQL